MNTITTTTETEDVKISVRLKLSALWIAMMFVYIYADIFSLYKPGVIEAMMGGRMGPFPVTQASLLTASILVIIPAVMVFLSLVLTPKAGEEAYRVVVGPYPSREAAESAGRRLGRPSFIYHP